MKVLLTNYLFSSGSTLWGRIHYLWTSHITSIFKPVWHSDKGSQEGNKIICMKLLLFKTPVTLFGKGMASTVCFNFCHSTVRWLKIVGIFSSNNEHLMMVLLHVLTVLPMHTHWHHHSPILSSVEFDCASAVPALSIVWPTMISLHPCDVSIALKIFCSSLWWNRTWVRRFIPYFYCVWMYKHHVPKTVHIDSDNEVVHHQFSMNFQAWLCLWWKVFTFYIWCIMLKAVQL